jgi:hypothetical protein
MLARLESAGYLRFVVDESLHHSQVCEDMTPTAAMAAAASAAAMCYFVAITSGCLE